MLRPHTYTQPKPLIPVAGKPILGHIVEAMHRAGIEEFVFVIGYLGEKIRDYVTREFAGRFRVHFVVQEPRLGLAHAIGLCAEHIVGGEPVAITLGDTIIDADYRDLLAQAGSIVCTMEVDTPEKFGIAEIDEQGYIRSLVEKPSIPRSNLALVGFYKIEETQLLFTAIRELMADPAQSSREYYLTDALMRMVTHGAKIRAVKVRNWYDCGVKQALLDTNRILLSQMKPTVPADRFVNSVIIPPVFIPDSCDIRHAIIGPYVALGENTQITSAIVQNSIIGSYARIEHVMLHDAVVGNDSTLRGRWQSMNIGDNTEIDFNQ
jgi:glucose-1-phosphate thymidylyltransferase